MAKHSRQVALHRIGLTELRVLSDVESDLAPLIEVEEEVIEKYAASPRWRQETVTLFVLRDLGPLIRQLSPDAALPPGGLGGLNQKPIVNVYDVNNPRSCHIFVNQSAMLKEGYWGDGELMEGLLAHEHAHPLSECETTRSARRLRADLSTEAARPLFAPEERDPGWRTKVERLLILLVDKLCLYAPREIFANDLTLASGFLAALLHLDKKNLANAIAGLRSRGQLQQMLQQEVEKGSLTPAGANLLLTIGDMKGYLDLALETAPLYRQNRTVEARELEELVFVEVLPHLEPQVADAYAKLRDAYVELPEDASPDTLRQWGEALIRILAEVLHEKGLQLGCQLSVISE